MGIKNHAFFTRSAAALATVMILVFLAAACNPAAIPATSPPLPTRVFPTAQPTRALTASSVPSPTPTSEALIATVNVRSVNLRTGPGIEFGVVNTLIEGEEVVTLGRNLDSSWLYVRTADALLGWVAVGLLDLQGNLEQIPLKE